MKIKKNCEKRKKYNFGLFIKNGEICVKKVEIYVNEITRNWKDGRVKELINLRQMMLYTIVILIQDVKNMRNIGNLSGNQ